MNENMSLDRTLTLLPVVLFGLAYMAPMTVFTTYGVAAQASHGMLPSAYAFALLAMLFTAYSYGRMVKAYPVAGSAYTYTQKSINGYVGFLVGWSILMDYLFLPMLNYLTAGIFLSAAFPEIPSYIWILFMIAVITFINIRGIKVTANINTLLISYQFLVILFFCLFAVKGVISGMGTGTLVSTLPFLNPEVSFSFVLAGASILCLSFLGFDSVTTLSEETIHSEKTIPRAIFLIACIGGALFIGISYIAHMAYPDFTSFKNTDSAAFEVAVFVGGKLFSSFFLAGMVTACLGSGLSSHASVSRLLYAMGRDSVISKKVFGYIHPRFKTPTRNILLVSVFSLSALVIDLVTAASFINFGALVAFTFVNLSVVFHYFIKKRQRSVKGTFLYLLLPLVGACFTVWLWTGLDKHSMILGGVWALFGFMYLAFLTKFFSQRPPELHFDEVEEAKVSEVS